MSSDSRPSSAAAAQVGAAERRHTSWELTTGAHTDLAMNRTTHVQTLRDRVACDDYAVDPQAVAASILERLIAGARRPQT